MDNGINQEPKITTEGIQDIILKDEFALLLETKILNNISNTLGKRWLERFGTKKLSKIAVRKNEKTNSLIIYGSLDGSEEPILEVNLYVENSSCTVNSLNVGVNFRRLGFANLFYDILEELLEKNGIYFLVGSMSDGGEKLAISRGNIKLSETDMACALRKKQILKVLGLVVLKGNIYYKPLKPKAELIISEILKAA